MYPNNRLRKPAPPPKPPRAPKGIFIVVGLIMLALLAGGFLFTQKNSQNKPAATQVAAPAFDKTQFSLEDPASIWVVVNKKRPLKPTDYAPSDLRMPNAPLRLQTTEMQLRNEAATAVEQLVASAKAEDINLMVASGYRSYDLQKAVYDNFVKSEGKAAADRTSARPGHSEHQTGLAVDLGPTDRRCEIEQCFAGLPEGQWVAANAHKFGFVLRYAEGKEAITGYDYEPWHLRYVGAALAEEMHQKNMQTLEEFFNLPAAPTY